MFESRGLPPDTRALFSDRVCNGTRSVFLPLGTNLRQSLFLGSFPVYYELEGNGNTTVIHYGELPEDGETRGR